MIIGGSKTYIIFSHLIWRLILTNTKRGGRGRLWRSNPTILGSWSQNSSKVRLIWDTKRAWLQQSNNQNVKAEACILAHPAESKLLFFRVSNAMFRSSSSVLHRLKFSLFVTPLLCSSSRHSSCCWPIRSPYWKKRFRHRVPFILAFGHLPKWQENLILELDWD